ncbi:putative oxidoreductase [Helianthus annuus]|uniref:Oxidoreductase n=1 Tax=Helianthus annuus TaxID=4232 RepID=A0A251SWS7_HELAN|nr:carotenoid cleavage dioxygenase 7, chloroplastic [Helianthus annuus]KAF5775572.1 putative oxidoreductase [Helianthus annuus]KAJ0499554.1 putative oxidoreductase [Helianthus annuus]KAJ0665565.1 putative oxidoreductase [Helianthus annuus]
MQAKAFNFIPLKLPSPAIKLPPAQAISFPDHVGRDMSIAIPNQEVSTSVEEEKMAAYWDYQFLFVSQRSETVNPVSLRVIEGSIPSDFPLGTYYLTGPGLFRDDHGSTVHPLDGHGYLRAFTIDGVKGEVKFMAKYIETAAQVEEHNRETGEWRFTHRGPFSVLKNGEKIGNTKVMKNVANTSVLRWGGRLFCLWEGGAPYEIDSRSLDTIGRFDLINGVDGSSTPSTSDRERRVGGDNMLDLATSILKPILYGVFKMPSKRLLSHYKIDASRNRLLMMSCNAEDMLLPRSNFTFYEFDYNFKILQKQEFIIPEHLMIHDWAFTDSHYILFGNRIKLDILGSMTAVCGFTPMITALSVNPSKSTSPIYLLPRFPEHEERRDWKVPIEAPSQMWVLHVGNAFQETDHNGNTQIQIQASGCSYKWFNFQKMFGYDWRSGKLDPSMMNADGGNKLLPHLIQVSINLDASGNCEECRVNPLNDQWDRATDFPVINHDFGGRNNTYVYAATSSGFRRELPHFPFDSVVKFNTAENTTQTWSVGTRRFIGEPIFVSKGSDEDDGYLLVVEYAVSKQMCYLVILDAKKVGETNAVVARLEVPKHLNFPLGFHGFWAPMDY